MGRKWVYAHVTFNQAQRLIDALKVQEEYLADIPKDVRTKYETKQMERIQMGIRSLQEVEKGCGWKQVVIPLTFGGQEVLNVSSLVGLEEKIRLMSGKS